MSSTFTIQFQSPKKNRVRNVKKSVLGQKCQRRLYEKNLVSQKSIEKSQNSKQPKRWREAGQDTDEKAHKQCGYQNFSPSFRISNHTPQIVAQDQARISESIDNPIVQFTRDAKITLSNRQVVTDSGDLVKPTHQHDSAEQNEGIVEFSET